MKGRQVLSDGFQSSTILDFRTSLPFSESPFQINYQQPILSLGSCFAEHIGLRLSDRKFKLSLNPFGILYNPVSILQSLELLRQGSQIKEKDLFYNQDLWHHFSFHSRFSHPNRQTALYQMNASIAQVHTQWKQFDQVILTWGSAYAFRHLEQDCVVANCHKLPGANFEHFRLQQDEFLPAYLECFRQWKKENPALQVLISVSPVRHLREGLVENQRGKAVLLLAAERLSQDLDFVHYFPAYELVLDDLRDYRFFDKDLTHPNPLAIDYVWDYFGRACLSTEAQKIAGAIEAVTRAVRHRPFHPQTASYQLFCKQQLQKIAKLERSYPFLNFDEESTHFQRFI